MNANNLVYLVSYKTGVPEGEGLIFEIVMPYLGSIKYKNDIEFPEETEELLYNGDQQFLVHRLEYKGNVYYILEDFYGFDGDPTNKDDIDRYYAKYEHGRIRISDRNACAFHYRLIEPEETDIYEVYENA